MRCRAMPLLALLGMVACVPEQSGQPASRIATPSIEGAESRDIKFTAENGEQSVIADCILTAAGINTQFKTPAILSFPVNDEGRVSIDGFSCRYNGKSYGWNAIPGEDTRGVLTQFGGGFAETYFLRRGNTVLYVIRGGEFVTVSGSPDP